MKNLFYCAIFFLLNAPIFAQNTTVEGKIVDAVTGETIPGAAVALANTNFGTVTNDEGVFRFSGDEKGTLNIQFLGYKEVAMPMAAFGNSQKTIMLEQNEEVLEEIIVSQTPIHEILMNLINSSIGALDKKVILKTYAREFVTVNDKPTKFADALVDFHVVVNKDKITSETIIKQNRRAQLFTESDVEENPMENMDSFYDIKKAVSAPMSFQLLYRAFIKGKKYKGYDMLLKSIKSKDNGQLMAITIKPVKTNDDAYHAGTITYDPVKKLILDIDLKTAPRTEPIVKVNVLIIKLALLDVTLKQSFKSTDNYYGLNYTYTDAKIRVWNRKKYDEIIESKSDLVVTGTSAETGYDKAAVFTGKHLYEKEPAFTTNFWNGNNAIVLTKKEQKIVDDLEKAEVKK